MPLTKEMCSETDVVEEHHCQNGFPHAPDPQCLHDIHQQLSGNSVAPLLQETPLNKDLSTRPSCRCYQRIISSPSWTKRYHHKIAFISLQILRSYWMSQTVCTVCTAIDPFPSQAWFIDEKSSAYITEAITEHNEQGIFIPPRTSHVTSMNWPSLMIDRILATLLQRPGHSHKFFYLPVTCTNMISSFGKC